jgi:hypothetical protein
MSTARYDTWWVFLFTESEERMKYIIEVEQEIDGKLGFPIMKLMML